MSPLSTQLNGFTIGPLLGSGGMSTVWQARQHTLDREVALKVLAPEMSSSPEDVKRFILEARLAAKLKHVNLVQVFDVLNQNGTYFYIMEYIRGYDVGQWMERKGRIDPMEALAVAESIAVALEYAWREVGLIHCDIKPGNIMVDIDGTVKLTDLGVARSIKGAASGNDDNTHITGTPAYMAPEQVTGELELDSRTDIYALGATLYHMVTGRKLFPKLSDDETMEKQCSAQAPDAREFVPDLSPHYSALLEKFLSKDPTYRPRNWYAAMQDLRQIRRGQFPFGKQTPAGGSTMHRQNPVARLVEEDEEVEEVVEAAPMPPPMAVARNYPLPFKQYLRLLDVSGLPRWAISLLAIALFLLGFAVVFGILSLLL